MCGRHIHPEMKKARGNWDKHRVFIVSAGNKMVFIIRDMSYNPSKIQVDVNVRKGHPTCTRQNVQQVQIAHANINTTAHAYLSCDSIFCWSRLNKPSN